ncbi:hypothetical protein FACS1894181_14500 [Bacteroidia bacterium]|nr:hypothetical protein FACS1894181_14500 [Bacteroidia bacterium]
MKNDYLARLLALLILTFAGCWGLSYLPPSLFGQKIKKVDFFSDLRTARGDTALEALRAQLEGVETGEALLPNTGETEAVDSIALVAALRDSLSKAENKIPPGGSKGERIEDYSGTHSGLKRFFAALEESKNRPVRIAFLGDSFVEGDILVADFRNSLQQMFGGRGVGFVPVTSVAAQYRTTVAMKASGWKMYSLINDKQRSYPLPGLLFETTSGKAALVFQTTRLYASLGKANSLKFLYDRNEATVLQLDCNNDTIESLLPSSDKVSQYEFTGDTISSGTFTFTDAHGFRALGFALENNTGVVVDNLSLRGNSGLLFSRLDTGVCEAWNEVRPYDLIILQYGLNVASEGVLDYSWYRARMIETVRHLQGCFPQSDFLMLSVSDRGNQYDGEFATMPAVLALLGTQRQIARQTQIPFWNMFGGMGGENSMVRFVKNGWAGKDYTHLTVKGGVEISKSLMKALMLEKEFYDELEKEE